MDSISSKGLICDDWESIEHENYKENTPTIAQLTKSVPLQIAKTVLPGAVQGATIACAAMGAISFPFAATVFAGSKVADCALNVIFTEKKQAR